MSLKNRFNLFSAGKFCSALAATFGAAAIAMTTAVAVKNGASMDTVSGVLSGSYALGLGVFCYSTISRKQKENPPSP